MALPLSLAVAFVAASCAHRSVGTAVPGPPSTRSWPSYAYGSPAFAAFVDDSYDVAKRGRSQDFFDWMDREFDAAAGNDIESFAAAARNRMQGARSPAARTVQEVQTAREVHRLVKRAIPRFSLDRGFEFHQTEALGERQCFLQSVLIAGLLQACGVEAGVVMVYLNEKGDSTNNGHAVTLLRLASGNELVVDASEPRPFATHRGLFVATGSEPPYRYVRPTYASGDVPFMVAGTAEGPGGRLPPSALRPVDIGFLRSQFDYYRGERAPGGILAKPPTSKGLAQSAKFLERSVRECGQNPLAVYMLGTVYEALGDLPRARERLQFAKGLYEADGWVPAGVELALRRLG